MLRSRRPVQPGEPGSYEGALSEISCNVATVLSEMPNVRGEETDDICDHALDLFVMPFELASQYM